MVMKMNCVDQRQRIAAWSCNQEAEKRKTVAKKLRSSRPVKRRQINI
jgi:hypothetical protein